MKRTLFSIAAILCASVVLFSCSKDNDPVYPDDSQALTSVFAVKSSDWETENNGASFYFSIDEPEITSEINDNGAVWIYYSFDDGWTYELAPSLAILDDNNHSFDFLAVSGLDNNENGYVALTAINNSNTVAKPIFRDQNNQEIEILVKVVSIPSSLYQAHKNVNKKDYNEVRRVFNLK